MLEYPRWKYLVVGIVMVLALVFALPNFFGEDLALQVARWDGLERRVGILTATAVDTSHAVGALARPNGPPTP